MRDWEESTIMYILDMCDSLSKDSLVFLKNNIDVKIDNLEEEEN